MNRVIICASAFLFLLFSACGGEDAEFEARRKISELNVPYGDSDFVHRATVGDHVAIELYLQSGMDPNTRDQPDHSALCEAARHGHIRVVRLLLQYGANPNQRGTDRRTPLMISSESGNAELVELLLSKDADVHAKFEDDATVLMLACRSDHSNTEVINRLIRAGAGVNAVDSDSKTALYLACWRGDPSAVALLLSQGADPNLLASGRLSPLQMAVRSGDHKSVDLLLRAGADTSLLPRASPPLTVVAARLDRPAIVLSLLQSGCPYQGDFRFDNCQARTLLMWATENGHLEVVRALFQLGADPLEGEAMVLEGCIMMKISALDLSHDDEIRNLVIDAIRRLHPDSGPIG